MTSIAEDLSTKRYRFLTDVQIGFLRRQHKASRDEVRTAAIVADRIRRHRQAEEQRNSFRADLVPIGAPVVLPREVKQSLRKWDRKA